MKLGNSLYCVPIYQDVYFVSQLLAIAFKKSVFNILLDDSGDFINTNGKLKLSALQNVFRNADGQWLRFESLNYENKLIKLVDAMRGLTRYFSRQSQLDVYEGKGGQLPEFSRNAQRCLMSVA